MIEVLWYIFMILTSPCFTDILTKDNNLDGFLGPVVQSIVSLTSSFRVQLVKCFTTL